MASNNDIEDVLSSIRRLVSVNPGTANNLAINDDTQESDTGVEGRFVLTEAYRVPDDAAESPDAETVARSHDQDAADETHAAPHEVTQSASEAPARRVLRLLPNNDDLSGNETDDSSSDSAPDEADDQDWNSAALFFSTRNAEDETGEEVIPPQTQGETPDSLGNNDTNDLEDAVSVSSTSEQPVDLQSVRALEQTIAELEQAVGSQPDEWEPDGTDSGREIPDRIVHFTPPHIAESSREAAEGDPAPIPADAAPSVDTDAAITADIGAEEIVQENEHAQDTGLGGLIDEDTLHDLVTEIVRQELQGALGERITRNVRKLVRREIQIALAADKLD